jgi:hypothetical protein
MRRFMRKQTNVIDGRRIEIQEKFEQEKKQRFASRMKAKGEFVEKSKTALDRFNI